MAKVPIMNLEEVLWEIKGFYSRTGATNTSFLSILSWFLTQYWEKRLSCTGLIKIF